MTHAAGVDVTEAQAEPRFQAGGRHVQGRGGPLDQHRLRASSVPEQHESARGGKRKQTLVDSTPASSAHFASAAHRGVSSGRRSSCRSEGRGDTLAHDAALASTSIAPAFGGDERDEGYGGRPVSSGSSNASNSRNPSVFEGSQRRGGLPSKDIGHVHVRGWAKTSAYRPLARKPSDVSVSFGWPDRSPRGTFVIDGAPCPTPRPGAGHSPMKVACFANDTDDGKGEPTAVQKRSTKSRMSCSVRKCGGSPRCPVHPPQSADP